MEGEMRSAESTHEFDSRKTLALVLAGGSGSRLQGLTRTRAKPAVPFAAHHRIVDFSLSNCVNSGVERIALLTQYEPKSLTDHVQRNWQAPRPGLRSAIEIWPAQQRPDNPVYAGTADAVHKNRDLIEALDPDDVLIVASDHVYAMDYTKLRASHAAHRADVTISCVEVPASQSKSFGIVEVDDKLRIQAFVEKPDWPVAGPAGRHTALASMGVYLFDAEYLLECLDADAQDPDSRHDFGYSIMPRVLAEANVFAHLFRDRNGETGYWRDVGTVDSYWHAHQELLAPDAKLDLASPNWPIFGSRRQRAPARLSATAKVAATMLGAGSFVSGRVTGSVLSTGCLVGDGSHVTDSVLLPNSTVGRNCRLHRVILDSHCHVPDDTVIDAKTVGSDGRFHVSPKGVVLVTQDALEFRDPLEVRRIA
jgi:glucose-1-phosphate adenylyltransferase